MNTSGTTRDIEMMNKYDLLNRTVLAQSNLWIQNHLDEKPGEEIPAICYKIKTAGYNSLHINRFSSEEAKLLKEATNSEEFKPIRETDISLIIMPLEVMKLWVEDVPKEHRPTINISDKKLLMGKNTYFSYMLEIKKSYPKMYKDQKEIIDRTVRNSRLWYNHLRKHTLKEEI